jgi:hypothetical protein
MFSETLEETPRTKLALLGSEFDAFLFAPIGDEPNGIPLSLASALARQDIDPWQEATSLARLPLAVATTRLEALIAAVPNRSSNGLGPAAIAARQLTFLPGAASAFPSRLRALDTNGAPTAQQAILCMVAFFTIVSLTFAALSGAPSKSPSAGAPAISGLHHDANRSTTRTP